MQKLIRTLGHHGHIQAHSIVCCLLFLVTASAQATLPAGFTNELVVGGLNQPIDMAFLPDSRALVLQKGGEIIIVDLAASPPTFTSYMTITDIFSDDEKGLLAIALDPDFVNNDFFYLYYTRGSVGKFRIARFTHLGNTGDITSEQLVWENPQDTTRCCHYGGGLSFGPEGALYLTTGENFDPNQAQDLTLPGGKVIRVNTDGSIPVDNPFIDGPGGNLDEIWAYGLRNPFRASWDLPGNRLFIGEVGGNDQSVATEDIHLGRSGANYGWPYCEGACGDPLYDDPVFFYPHQGSGASVSGGFVYRGLSFPASFDGAYFYGDYVRDYIRYLTFNPDGSVAGDFDFESSANAPVGMKQGIDGSLYYVDIWNGQFRRITYEQGNQRPIITLTTSDVADGTAPLSVTFTAGAIDPENQLLTYRWLFGDGAEADGSVLVHEYAANGIYNARFSVTDGVHTVFSDFLEIRVGTPPQVAIVEPVDGQLFRAGELISLAGSAIDPDGVPVDTDYSWTVLFNHNEHNHPGLDELIGPTASFSVADTGHDFSDDTGFDITLTVTDVDGLAGTETVTILPDKVDITLDSNLPGITLRFDGIVLATPFVIDTLIDFRHTVLAPLEQCINGSSYVFSDWSDGGAATHEILVPDGDWTLTANYFDDGECFPRVTSGLQAFYEFSSGTGPVVLDQSGIVPALDLTIADESAVNWIPGGGLSVDSVTSIKTPGAATRLGDALKTSQEMTIEAWVTPAAGLDQSGPARIIAYSEDGFPTGGNFALGQNFGGVPGTARFGTRLRTNTTNKYGTPSLDTTGDSALGSLLHVIFTRSSSGATAMYLDGVEVATGTRNGTFDTWADSPLSLANEPDEGRPWLGELHLVAIYDRALDIDEVNENFVAGLAVAVVVCGNGVAEGSEQCDDGNTVSGDCCSDSCQYEVAGSSCDDSTVCNGLETCDGAGSCDAGTPLVCDDGAFCNGAESCDAGLGCQAGTPPVIDDGVVCTDDSCDEVGDLVVNAVNHGNCDDADVCNGAETCDAALDCQSGTPLVCDDGAFCNGSESCDAGLGCQAGTPPVIDDGVVCTDDSCDEVGDLVVNAVNNGNCDDADVCNGAETCDAALDCQAGTPLVCDDGAFCNGSESCDAGLGCQAGTPPVIDDGVVCTDDSCDEVGDAVVNAPDDLACDDADPCTADSCDQISGCGNAPIPLCGTGVPATPGWGLWLLAGLLLTAAGLIVRERRRTAA